MKTKTVDRIREFVKPHRKKIIVIILLLIVESFANLANPLFAKVFIDEVLMGHNPGVLVPIFSGIFILFFVKYIVSTIYNVLKLKVFQKIFFDISLKATKKAIKMPVEFHKKSTVGYLSNRIIHDAKTCVDTISLNGVTAVSNAFTFLAGVSVLFYLNPKLALITITVVPAFAAASHLYKFRMKEQHLQQYESEAKAMGILQEMLSAYYTMYIFDRAKYELRRLIRAFKSIINAHFRLFASECKIGLIIGFLATCGPVMLMWFGYLEIKSGNLTLGEYIAFATYIGMLYGPATEMAKINVKFRGAIVSAARVFEIMDLQEDILEIEKPVVLNQLSTEIEFRDVGFSYGDKPEWRLQDLNMNIKKGETVAIVGKSGSGKTSLINLVQRFYDIDEGEILIDGVNIKNYKISSLRKNIGYVSQDTFLFNDSLYNNILYGDLEASPEQVFEACRQADCIDFIQSFAKGFETMCGERGVKLSGGQRQRISIARTLLKNPSILILDEATSSLDRHSIENIQAALDKLMAGRTTIVISHRISTIRHADKIFVLDEGTFAEWGTHQQLSAQGGRYHALLGPQYQTA